jgi:hypothetical protein
MMDFPISWLKTLCSPILRDWGSINEGENGGQVRKKGRTLNTDIHKIFFSLMDLVEPGHRPPTLFFGIFLETVYNQSGFEAGRTFSEGGRCHGSRFCNLGNGRETGD